MKKVLFIVAPENFRDEELFEPMEVLKRDSLVYVASRGVKKAKGVKGGSVNIDLDIDDVEVDDYDTIIFIGGGGSKIYFDDKTVQEIARDAYAKGKIVGAICIAPTILANAGLLKGMKATSHSGQEDKLKEKGAAFVYENVVKDGRIVTAIGPHAAKKFGETIKEMLKQKVVQRA